MSESLPAQVGKARSLRSFAELDPVVLRIPFHQPDMFLSIDRHIPADTSSIRSSLVQLNHSAKAGAESRNDVPGKRNLTRWMNRNFTILCRVSQVRKRPTVHVDRHSDLGLRLHMRFITNAHSQMTSSH